MGLLDRLFGGPAGSNIDGIDEGRRVLAEHEFAALLDPDRRPVDAVKALRRRVPSLSLVDATRLVRRARGEE